MALPRETPDLEVLDLLVAVAELGSLGRAAAQAGISQPAASMRINALERKLRLVLLDRGPTGSRLTAAGAAVVEWAVPVLTAARRLVAGVTALHSVGQSALRVAASMTIADHLIPGWLVTLRAELPEVAVSLSVGNSQDVANLVRDSVVDLGFVEGPSGPQGLRSKVVGEDRLVVVVAAQHPWARRKKPLPVQTLAATPLVLREPGSGTRDAVWEMLSKVGGPATPAAELGSTAAIKAAARAGLAPTVLSRLMVAGELRERTLVEVPLTDERVLHRRLRAVWRPELAPQDAAAVLLRVAAESEGRRRPL